jgi:hypothetical protein
MKRLSGLRKTTCSFSESIQQQLNMYALAAGAAGVSVLALTQPSEAKIIYTKANVTIGENQRYDLDLNHDGITDFTILDVHTVVNFYCRFFRPFAVNLLDLVHTPPGNGIAGSSFADALTKGVQIGQGFQFASQARVATHSYGSRRFQSKGCMNVNHYYGKWVNVTDRYLGLKFMIHAKTHYGWARLSVQVAKGKGITAKLTGYAYETIPGKSIKAGQTKGGADEWDEDDRGPEASVTNPIPGKPQPALLGMLALGAQGVTLWRRRESVVATRKECVVQGS